MISAIGNVITSMISWIGQVITALVNAGDGNTDPGGRWHALLPLFAIGIVASLLMFSVKINMDSQGYLGLLSLTVGRRAAVPLKVYLPKVYLQRNRFIIFKEGYFLDTINSVFKEVFDILSSLPDFVYLIFFFFFSGFLVFKCINVIFLTPPPSLHKPSEDLSISDLYTDPWDIPDIDIKR